MKNYRRIIFFEESVGSGSISEKTGFMLAESGYCGSYSRVAVEGFVKQAKVKSSLSQLGLSCEKIADYVRRKIINAQT